MEEENKRIRVNFRLPEEIIKKLDDNKKETGRCKERIVEFALVEYLSK